MFVWAVPETSLPIILFSLYRKDKLCRKFPISKSLFWSLPRFGKYWDEIMKPLKFKVKMGFSASWKPMFSAFVNQNFLPHLAMFASAFLRQALTYFLFSFYQKDKLCRKFPVMICLFWYLRAGLTRWQASVRGCGPVCISGLYISPQTWARLADNG